MQTKKDISRKKRGARRRKRKRKPKKRGSAWRKPKSERRVPHRKSPAGTKNGCLRAMVFEFYFSMSFSTFCGAVGEESGCTGICTEAAAGAETGA